MTRTMNRLATLLLAMGVLAATGPIVHSARAQTPPPTPEVTPVPDARPSADGPFRPTEEVGADAEVDFPGDL